MSDSKRDTALPSDRAGGPTDLSRDASQPEALIPSAIEPWEIEAQQASDLGVRYRMIQEGEYGCSKIICTFPHDGNCWCFNKALAEHTAQAIEARRAATGTGAVHESAVRQDAPETPSEAYLT